ncbi:hypothetical protein E2562_027623 [Oryza meyeriana var. granulata]|uniref:LysM domain-containing protein n=1 Tax=Oryza meyeriana var. granulata TaxID=110450 RepID=A0A6G1E351_9ORYZ|nr:hypothetical protein E2562_027623 [Oryza meyeriana var. granulata]
MATHTLLLLAMASVSLVCARVVDARSLPEGSRRRSLEGRAEWQPMRCNATSSSPSAPPTCTSYLYVTPNGRSPATVASDLSVNAALMQPIRRQSGEVDLLAQVPCVCEGAAGNGAAAAAALFHDTIYTVKTGDTPASVSDKIFGGLAVDFADGGSRLEGDDMREIATLFRSSKEAILKLNPSLVDPDFVKPRLVHDQFSVIQVFNGGMMSHNWKLFLDPTLSSRSSTQFLVM